jgi:hypothetical protein
MRLLRSSIFRRPSKLLKRKSMPPLWRVYFAHTTSITIPFSASSSAFASIVYLDISKTRSSPLPLPPNIHNNNPPATDQITTPPTTANMQFKLSFQISLLAIAMSKCMAAPIPASSITSDAAGRDIVVRKGCSPPRPTTYCSKWDKDLDHCVQWNDEQTTKPTLSERDVTQVDISGGETGRDTIEVDATKVDAPKVDNTKGDTTKADSHKKLTCDNCFPYFSVSIL